MDGEWLNRAGILAELVSFVLIAPEILGRERLSLAQAAFERLARDPGSPALVRRRGQGSRFVPKMVRRPGCLGDASFVVGLAATLAILLGGAIWVAPDAISTWQVALIFAAPFFGTLIIARVTRRRRSVRKLRRDLAPMGAPVDWMLTAVSLVVFLTLRLGVNLLGRENAVRALVFGTGVVLLFGGMAAQFASTF